MRLDTSRLEKVKRNADRSITCRCPQCKEEGGDSTGNHLRVWINGAFSCVTHVGDRMHNRQIRAYLMNTALEDNPEIEYIDPEPTVTSDKVYPEDTIRRLVKDYSYWIGRGVSPSVLERLECGMAPEDEKSKLSKRFIFPIRGLDGRISGFTARLVEENSFAPKWKILGKKGSFIFPSKRLSEPEIRAKSQVILVESIGCVLALANEGIWNTMCLFGLHLSSKQLAHIIGLGTKEIIIATNNEASGIGNRAAERLKDRLSAFFAPDGVLVHLPYAKDFIEMEKSDITKWYLSVYDGT